MSAPARVVIVGCGFPQLGLLHAARELGLTVFGVDANPQAIGAALCSDFHEVSTDDVDRIAEVAQKVHADGITTCGSEIALASTARAAERLGMPFYGDVATVDRCQAKIKCASPTGKGVHPSPLS